MAAKILLRNALKQKIVAYSLTQLQQSESWDRPIKIPNENIKRDLDTKCFMEKNYFFP
jgi:hypothetical protein